MAVLPALVIGCSGKCETGLQAAVSTRAVMQSDPVAYQWLYDNAKVGAADKHRIAFAGGAVGNEVLQKRFFDWFALQSVEEQADWLYAYQGHLNSEKGRCFKAMLLSGVYAPACATTVEVPPNYAEQVVADSTYAKCTG